MTSRPLRDQSGVADSRSWPGSEDRCQKRPLIEGERKTLAQAELYRVTPVADLGGLF